ncbi:MFS transporter [Streptomyces sp. NPDC004787]|uniref:MFS transporter n=1 Tax=Streptomyces sp. NPDC004787 TaxID=3154291 RepID=UPI0033A78425
MILQRYRVIFDKPGTARFCIAGLISRMPMSMLGVGAVTMMSEMAGSYVLAGLLAAALSLSCALMAPRISRLVDVYGQRRVLRPTLIISAGAVAALVLSAYLEASFWILLVCAFIAGCMPYTGSMVRARWAHLYRGTEELQTAYAIEAALDEVCFILGPVLAIGLSALVFPAAGLIAAVALLTFGGWWLAAQPDTEPPVALPDTRHTGSAMRFRGMITLVMTSSAAGVVFGSLEVVTVAFAEEQDAKPAASVALASFACASMLSGLVMGARKPSSRPDLVFLCSMAAMSVTTIPYMFVENVWMLFAVSFVAGLAVCPMLAASMALVEQLVPKSQLTEGLTWLPTGETTGIAAGSATAGWIIDVAGAGDAFILPFVASFLGAVIAVCGRKRLRPPTPGGTRRVATHGSAHKASVANSKPST